MMDDGWDHGWDDGWDDGWAAAQSVIRHPSSVIRKPPNFYLESGIAPAHETKDF
jgi:hypothetical protein